VSSKGSNEHPHVAKVHAQYVADGNHPLVNDIRRRRRRGLDERSAADAQNSVIDNVLSGRARFLISCFLLRIKCVLVHESNLLVLTLGDPTHRPKGALALAMLVHTMLHIIRGTDVIFLPTTKHVEGPRHCASLGLLSAPARLVSTPLAVDTSKWHMY